MSPLPPLADFRASTAPAVVILGNDAVLAARPATPVQLAHACLAAGFRAVVPASWGDELVAGATLDALSGRANRPAIQCACPHVARRVLAVGSELATHLISLVAPPVAAARYLRLNAAGELRVTYVGRCPAAADDSIDARLTPEELLAQLADRGIDLAAQPEVFESVIPPDRRRHLSLPGGLPSPDTLWARERAVVETMKGDDFATELAGLVLARKDALIDAAPMVGCVCSGALRGSAPAEGRMSVVALEPPRSMYPVVDERGALSLELPLPLAARDPADLVAEPARTAPAERQVSASVAPLGDAPPSPPVVPSRRPRLTPPGITAVSASAGPPPAAPSAPPRRRSPVGTPRVVPGAVPVSSDSEGRILPRAYVARRRSPRSGIPAITDSSLAAAMPTEPMAPPPVVPREPAPRHTIEATHADETSRGAADSERPVVRSVEPAVVAPPSATLPPSSTAAPAATVRQGTRAAKASVVAAGALVGAQVARAMALARKRSWLLAAGAIAGSGLLLGVAIGYAVAHRRAPATSAGTERGADTLSSSVGTAGVRESVSAGGIAPAAGATRRAAARAPSRAPSPGQRGVTRPLAASPSPDRQSAGAPAATPPLNASAPVATSASPVVVTTDSAAARVRRDSVTRTESLAAERDSIRREIERRRSRVDSIERARLRLDSIQRAEQAGNRPPAQ